VGLATKVIDGSSASCVASPTTACCCWWLRFYVDVALEFGDDVSILSRRVTFAA
jgi:hypothetical protein